MYPYEESEINEPKIVVQFAESVTTEEVYTWAKLFTGGHQLESALYGTVENLAPRLLTAQFISIVESIAKFTFNET